MKMVNSINRFLANKLESINNNIPPLPTISFSSMSIANIVYNKIYDTAIDLGIRAWYFSGEMLKQDWMVMQSINMAIYANSTSAFTNICKNTHMLEYLAKDAIQSNNVEVVNFIVDNGAIEKEPLIKAILQSVPSGKDYIELLIEGYDLTSLEIAKFAIQEENLDMLVEVAKHATDLPTLAKIAELTPAFIKEFEESWSDAVTGHGKHLLENGADVDLMLTFAIREANGALIRESISYGANLEQIHQELSVLKLIYTGGLSKEESSAKFPIIKVLTPLMVEFLRGYGANAEDLLLVALQQDNAEMVAQLIDDGANGTQYLEWASTSLDNEEVKKVLVSKCLEKGLNSQSELYNALINTITLDDVSLLQDVIFYYKKMAVEGYELSPLQLATLFDKAINSNASKEFGKVLLSEIIGLNDTKVENDLHQTAINLAIYSEDIDSLKSLANKNAAGNLVDPDIISGSVKYIEGLYKNEKAASDLIKAFLESGYSVKELDYFQYPHHIELDIGPKLEQKNEVEPNEVLSFEFSNEHELDVPCEFSKDEAIEV